MIVLTSIVAGQTLTINAENNDDGTGTFTMASSMALNTNNAVLRVTAADVDIQGTLASGTQLTVITVAGGRTLGLGPSSGQQFQLSDAELDKVTSNGLSLGGATSGAVTVTGVTQANSNFISNVITILATLPNAALTFATTPSTFNALAVQADNGIYVQVDVTTDVGVVTLDGDQDNNSEGHDKIAFSGARTLTAAGTMTLDATGGGIVRSGSTTLTLTAASGVDINDAFSSTVTSQQLHINADSTDTGTGTFTVASTKALNSNNGPLSLTAANIDIQGTLSTGTSTVVIHGSAATAIRLGTAATSGMDIESAELQRVTAAGLTLGGTVGSADISVVAVLLANSDHITGPLTPHCFSGRFKHHIFRNTIHLPLACSTGRQLSGSRAGCHRHRWLSLLGW